MDAKTALRGPNSSAGPFARSTANAAHPRARSAKPVSLTSSGNQYGLSCTQNTKTYLWASQTGLGHDYLDHRRMYVQERSLKVSEHPVPGLHASPDHECLSPPHQSDRVARSALPQSPCARVLVPAVLSGRGMNTCPSNNNRRYSPSPPLSCPGVRVEAFGVRSCSSPVLQS